MCHYYTITSSSSSYVVVVVVVVVVMVVVQYNIQLPLVSQRLPHPGHLLHQKIHIGVEVVIPCQVEVAACLRQSRPHSKLLVLAVSVCRYRQSISDSHTTSY